MNHVIVIRQSPTSGLPSIISHTTFSEERYSRYSRHSRLETGDSLKQPVQAGRPNSPIVVGVPVSFLPFTFPGRFRSLVLGSALPPNTAVPPTTSTSYHAVSPLHCFTTARVVPYQYYYASSGDLCPTAVTTNFNTGQWLVRKSHRRSGEKNQNSTYIFLKNYEIRTSAVSSTD